MLYDQPVNITETYAPVQMTVGIRSQPLPFGFAQQKTQNSTPDYHVERRNYLDNKSTQRFDLDRFTQKLSGITTQRTSHSCAKSIRVALESAGANVQGHPIAAADWGGSLLKLGYRQITKSFDQPQKGDIYIINRSAAHPSGHIAGYTGSGWVSDFTQRSHAVYRNDNVSYSYFRLDDNE